MEHIGRARLSMDGDRRQAADEPIDGENFLVVALVR